MLPHNPQHVNPWSASPCPITLSDENNILPLLRCFGTLLPRCSAAPLTRCPAAPSTIITTVITAVITAVYIIDCSLSDRNGQQTEKHRVA